jgi:hypothetical protein
VASPVPGLLLAELHTTGSHSECSPSRCRPSRRSDLKKPGRLWCPLRLLPVAPPTRASSLASAPGSGPGSGTFKGEG